MRYRTLEGGSRCQTFLRRVDAEAFVTEVEHAKRRGVRRPCSRKRRFGDYADEWLCD
ncbi:MAG: hypothetical protein M5T61_18940 [Acidimicrobiia bacterium]|nr:hypothetical protein [Acidimicrobiia bacterium]